MLKIGSGYEESKDKIGQSHLLFNITPKLKESLKDDVSILIYLRKSNTRIQPNITSAAGQDIEKDKKDG